MGVGGWHGTPHHYVFQLNRPGGEGVGWTGPADGGIVREGIDPAPGGLAGNPPSLRQGGWVATPRGRAGIILRARSHD
jgi:hypothetical protein